MPADDGIFIHTCVTPGCDHKVEFDDEPCCFTHSPDSGSSLRGYSARKWVENAALITHGDVEALQNFTQQFNTSVR